MAAPAIDKCSLSRRVRARCLPDQRIGIGPKPMAIHGKPLKTKHVVYCQYSIPVGFLSLSAAGNWGQSLPVHNQPTPCFRAARPAWAKHCLRRKRATEMYMQHMAISFHYFVLFQFCCSQSKLAEVIPDYPTAYRDKIYRCRYIIGAVKFVQPFGMVVSSVNIFYPVVKNNLPVSVVTGISGAFFVETVLHCPFRHRRSAELQPLQPVLK